MRVLLCRHAAAVDPDVAGSDEHRWLTPEGRAMQARVAADVLALGVRVSRVLTSPLVRAVQTAELLAAVHGVEGPIEVRPRLAFGTSATVASIAHEEAEPDATLALVGHEPRIRTAASQLLGGASLPGFRTAGACLLTLDDAGPARFEWLIDPREGTRLTTLPG